MGVKMTWIKLTKNTLPPSGKPLFITNGKMLMMGIYRQNRGDWCYYNWEGRPIEIYIPEPTHWPEHLPSLPDEKELE